MFCPNLPFRTSNRQWINLDASDSNWDGGTRFSPSDFTRLSASSRDVPIGISLSRCSRISGLLPCRTAGGLGRYFGWNDVQPIVRKNVSANNVVQQGYILQFSGVPGFTSSLIIFLSSVSLQLWPQPSFGFEIQREQQPHNRQRDNYRRHHCSRWPHDLQASGDPHCVYHLNQHGNETNREQLDRQPLLHE